MHETYTEVGHAPGLYCAFLLAPVAWIEAGKRAKRRIRPILTPGLIAGVLLPAVLTVLDVPFEWQMSVVMLACAMSCWLSKAPVRHSLLRIALTIGCLTLAGYFPSISMGTRESLSLDDTTVCRTFGKWAAVYDRSEFFPQTGLGGSYSNFRKGDVVFGKFWDDVPTIRVSPDMVFWGPGGLVSGEEAGRALVRWINSKPTVGLLSQ